MIITEFIEVKICHNNYRHYENMGYTRGKENEQNKRGEIIGASPLKNG